MWTWWQNVAYCYQVFEGDPEFIKTLRWVFSDKPNKCLPEIIQKKKKMTL